MTPDDLSLGVDTSMGSVTSTGSDPSASDASSVSSVAAWGSTLTGLAGQAASLWGQVTGKPLTNPATNPADPQGSAGTAGSKVNATPGFFRNLSTKWGLPLWLVIVGVAVVPGFILLFILWRLLRRKG